MKKYTGNYTAAAARALKASDKLHCQATENGEIYVCNGYFIFRMTQEEYTAIVQPVTHCDPGNWAYANGTRTDGGSAVMFSLIQTAIENDLDPYKYLTWLLKTAKDADLNDHDFVPDIPEREWISRGYVCIDGQHRIEKARRLGIKTLPAVVIRMEQHIPFVYKGYDRYVEYWNGKLKDRTEDALRW